ncbi:hypothetical protein [Flavobacterium sp.]|uniref:hypothetical protein n=1 Tax=Flavobacterium sp. TaxID=239 RepID=UPI002FDA9BC7
MKNLYRTLVLVLIFSSGFAKEHNGKYNKQKNIKKTVSVNADALLDISNKYGNVMVTTWDEDKIDIDVLITISGDDEDWVDKRLASITIDFDGSKSQYSAKTLFDKISNSSRRSSMEINYTVKIPKKGHLKIENQYGTIVTHDLLGSTQISCKYGKISLGKLQHTSNDIKIDYCSKSTIESVKNAIINAKYSGITIGNFNQLHLNTSYTDVSVANGNQLKYASNYGKIAIGKVGTIEGSGNYLTLKIDQVDTHLKINTNYSNFTLNALSPKANSITLNSGYTNIKLNHSPDLSFDFDITTKYANFKSEAALEYTSRIETQSSKSYKGYYKKSGGSKIVINSGYGNVNLNLIN